MDAASTAPASESPEAAAGSSLITVQLADGPAMVRGALASLLDQDKSIEVVAATPSSAETLQAVAGHKPAILIYQPPPSAMSGDTAELISQVLKRSPETKPIILAGGISPVGARAALKAGAEGYLLATDDSAELLRAIHSIASGTPVVNAAVAMAIAQDDRDDGKTWLSDRERQIIRLVALGFTNNEIGQKIHISGRTVETHRANIVRKLKLGSRADLVRYAIEHGMMP